MELFYSQSAQTWTEALPVGNGKIGAMVRGGAEEECLHLNEDTLWSGRPVNGHNRHDSKQLLNDMRTLIDQQRYKEADKLSKQLMGADTATYLPFADLLINVDIKGQVTGYTRSLDLETAIASVSYTSAGIKYERDVFVSYPDHVLVVKLKVSQRRALTFSAQFQSQLEIDLLNDGRRLGFTGECPAEESQNNEKAGRSGDSQETLRFAGLAEVLVKDGHYVLEQDKCRVEGATEAIIYVNLSTSYNGYNKQPASQGIDALNAVRERLDKVKAKHDEDILRDHIADYQALYQRVGLDLKSDKTRKATDERIKKDGAADSYLVELLFQYGRYLLIASSRKGSEPANLQGIWNMDPKPPWRSNYTLNINLQMNYWLAESANLAECHHPLMAFIYDLSQRGEETARTCYSCSGWTAHHNSDLWRHTNPVGNYGDGEPDWAIWPLSAAWLCQHLFEVYRYRMDETFLEAFAYPIMKKAALFYQDFLIKNEDGYLMTAPSTSPENIFMTKDGEGAAISKSATMDIMLIHELFSNVIHGGRVLNMDETFLNDLEQLLENLPPLQIGSKGQLQEWLEDFQEKDPHHRHVSHLYAVYPGNQLTEEEEPELFSAARRALELRGDEGTGWSLAWKMNLWARFKDGERAWKLVERLLTPIEEGVKGEQGGVYANLFDAHPPFQIDGNFGFTAGVIEMLIQSHKGYIECLPALPANWPAGAIKGVRVRGGFEFELEWRGHKFYKAVVHSLNGNILSLKAGQAVAVASDHFNDKVPSSESGFVTFPTEKRRTYVLKQVVFRS